MAGSLALLGLFVMGFAVQHQVFADENPWPATNPAQICGDTELLAGPTTAPTGAITVAAGDNSGVNFNQANKVFWFESGTHTIGTGLYSQITAGEGSTYVGAPGAVLDGQNLNLYAFTGEAEDVTVQYLTIKNFGRGDDNNNEGVVNHNSGTGWTIDHNTVVDNDGAGVFLGTDNTVSYNCLKDNGQYGFSMFKPPVEGDSAIKNIVLDHNEIAGNNTDDWENQIEGCGCTGGGKFWDVQGATVTNNWVHDNKSTGLWADTNNIDFLFENNYIEDNYGEGIWYEISYNATMRDNVFRRNAWVSGQNNTGSPAPAIYLSESGGDSRLASTVSGAAAIRIYDNNFEDNFSGVSIYENANRFCNSNGNTSTGYCTPFIDPTLIAEPHDYDYTDPINASHPCYTDIASEPYKTDCRWHAKNIEVNNNEFHFDDTVVPCAGTYCGAQALIATGADNLSWSPYTVSGVQNDVMFNNNNSFHDNKYYGNWKFAVGYGDTISFNSWKSSPYSQDADSTIEGQTTPPEPTPTVLNDLDADTSNIEGSTGHWEDWYSATTSQSTAEAHTGTHSLKVDVTDPWGWGVQLDNWPGFDAEAGTKNISFWGKLGTGTGVAPKMTVKWVSAGYSVLQTDYVTLPTLTSSWQKVSALVDAPDGTASVLVYLTGADTAGTSFYLDDFVVGNAPNVLDANTAGGETNAGHWQSWYSADVATTTTGMHSGDGALQVNITDPWGWALQLDNYPGFETGAGAKRISYWAKQNSGSVSSVTLSVKWFDENGSLLQTDPLPISALTTSWQKATANVTAPAGTTNAYLSMSSSSGTTGDSILVDDILVANAN